MIHLIYLKGSLLNYQEIDSLANLSVVLANDNIKEFYAIENGAIIANSEKNKCAICSNSPERSVFNCCRGCDGTNHFESESEV